MGCGVGGYCEGILYVKTWMGGVCLWIEWMLVRNDMTINLMDCILCKCGTMYDKTISRGVELWCYRGKEGGKKAEELMCFVRNRDWSDRQSEGHWSYMRIVTYNVNWERMHDSCRVRRRESLSVVYIGCVLPP